MLTLLRSLRQDRTLAVATLIATALTIYPLTTTRIVPFIDLPHHVALSRLLWDVVFKRGAEAYYEVDVSPMPYWTAYALLAMGIRAFGAYLGTKLVLALVALSVPLGVMRLAIALGRSPRVGILAFLLVWDFNAYFGWINHVLGVGLALFATAQVLEARSHREVIRTWPIGVLLALTHILPFAFLSAMLGIAALVRRGGLQLHALALAGPAAALVPWLLRSLSAPRVTNPGFVFDPIDVRWKSLFTYSLGSGPIEAGGITAAGVAFSMLLFGPLVLACLPQRREHPESRNHAMAVAPFSAALLLYLALPLSVARPVEHWGTYPRFATLILLSAMLVPAPKLTGRSALSLVPILLVIAWTSQAMASQFRSFNREVQAFYEVVRRVPRGASVLPLCYQNTFPSTRLPMGESLHGYITGETGGFNPYLFGQATNPIHYRKDTRLPAPSSWGRTASSFSMQAYGERYDFILVQGRSVDPLPMDKSKSSKEATLVLERDRFRLYRVR